MKQILNSIVVILVIFQILNSSPSKLFYYSEVQNIEISQRMAAYPPSLYRLANILEHRSESLLLYRLKSNFFSILNLNSLPFYLIPFLVIGIFHQFSKFKFSYFIIPLLLPLVVLTILGPSQPHANLSLYPFLTISCIYGIIAMVKK